MRDGRPVLERYYHGSDASQPYVLHSITKSVVSALVGIALEEGLLRSLDQRLPELLGPLPSRIDPRVRTITLRQLLTMTAGWGGEAVSGDHVVRAVLRRPLARAPGSGWQYDSGSSHLVSAILTRATGRDTASYAQEKLFHPLGIQPYQWSADPQGISSGSSGLVLRPRELALFGELFRSGGRWGERQLVPEAWVRESTSAHVRTDDPDVGYGYLWWTGDATHTYAALGYGGQAVVVAPRERAVVAVTADAENPPDTARLVELILPALRG
jgi:CubicO group peptidase (beta-lactamase class C family)